MVHTGASRSRRDLRLHESDSPRAAIAVDDRIRTQVGRLIPFPESGHPGRIEGTRELVIDRTPYIVAYRIDAEVIRILRVLHGAQLWPEEISEAPQEE